MSHPDHSSQNRDRAPGAWMAILTVPLLGLSLLFNATTTLAQPSPQATEPARPW